MTLRIQIEGLDTDEATGFLQACNDELKKINNGRIDNEQIYLAKMSFSFDNDPQPSAMREDTP